ncbi:hypothetical protein DL768_005923 [Monosporascus sp. mg162]|nr:hypothetical protein DL768_005923 [Monosporascus sp. mg162]
MRFNLVSTIAVLAAVAVAAPSGGSYKQKRTDGTCNGTSCRVGFENYECNLGSCVGEGGGDGTFCTVLDLQDGTRRTYCPVGCPDPGLC